MTIVVQLFLIYSEVIIQFIIKILQFCLRLKRELIFHCWTLDNIFAYENIGAVMSRNETKMFISQSLNSFGTFVGFFFHLTVIKITPF